MSTSENKVEVITEFLQRNARLGRLTNMVEVQLATGLELAVRGYRTNGSAQPVEREKVATALAEVARRSYEEEGLLLPALVVHFEDKAPGHRFVVWAAQAGLMELPDFDPDSGDNEDELEMDDGGTPRWPVTDEALAVHADQVAKVFAKYAWDQGAPDTLADLDQA